MRERARGAARCMQRQRQRQWQRLWASYGRASPLLVHVHLAGCGRMSRSQRRRGRGALCERGASVCTESEGQERLDREQVAGVRWPVVRRLRWYATYQPKLHDSLQNGVCGRSVSVVENQATVYPRVPTQLPDVLVRQPYLPASSNSIARRRESGDHIWPQCSREQLNSPPKLSGNHIWPQCSRNQLNSPPKLSGTGTCSVVSPLYTFVSDDPGGRSE